MDSPFKPLPPVEAFDLSLGEKIDLEPVRPLFFVPKLGNRPQDPIIEAINFENTAPAHTSTGGWVSNGAVNPSETEKRSTGAPQQEKGRSQGSEELLSVWLRAARDDDQGPARVRFVLFSHHHICLIYR
jgi:hypothetical protein